MARTLPAKSQTEARSKGTKRALTTARRLRTASARRPTAQRIRETLTWTTPLLVLAVAAFGAVVAIRWLPRTALPKNGSSERVVFSTRFDVSSFLKGNLHTHSNRSDGDSPPADVVLWYRTHGYRFLAISDHNVRSDPAEFSAFQDGEFRLLPAEEVTMTGAGRQVHVNALCTKKTIGGGSFASVGDALRWALGQVDEQRGVALINHPNFDHALDGADLLAARGAALLEIQSGHPYVFSDGIDARPSHEALWDQALSGGAQFMGVAVDDAHRLDTSGNPPANPGRAWIQVFGDQNEEAALCEALRQRRLYASTGAGLSRLQVTTDRYTVWLRGQGTVLFLGRGGSLLQRTEVIDESRGAIYALRGDESYVRARVETLHGKAWTPAVHVGSRPIEPRPVD